MNFLTVYLIGFALALFIVTYKYIVSCNKNGIDYRLGLGSNNILVCMIADALGSWFTVFMFIDSLINDDD